MIFFLANQLEPGSSDAHMRSQSYIPNSLRSAGLHLRLALTDSLERLPQPAFVRVWSSLAYLYPGLHPDGYDSADSGWPRVLRRFAAEAWRRTEAGQLADDELYPGEAQWCGLYDRMLRHTPEEMERRLSLAADHGAAA